MNSKPYDIVLLPETKLVQNSIELSKKLEKFGTYFTLDNKTYFPHLSLYMLQLNEDGLKKTQDFLSDFSHMTDTVYVNANEYHYEGNYLDIEYIKSDTLISIQEQIIHALNSVRDGLRERDVEKLPTATGETLFNINTFGYRSVGNLFFPHLTFTRFKNEQKDVLKTLPSKDIFEGKYNRIGIFELGDNGTCIREVGIWNLK